MNRILPLTLFFIGSLLNASEPALPFVLTENPPKENPLEPSLPHGLGDSTPPAPTLAINQPTFPIRFNGFLESRGAFWRTSNPVEPDGALAEIRWRIDATGSLKSAQFKVSTDLLYDEFAPTHQLNLRRGEGWLDLREAWIQWRPLEFLDLKLGRQIVTWGTGDLVFLNDFFPKDYRSFLLGRDESLLKAPTNALRATFYSDWGNFDLVLQPQFNPDRFITGERLSYFHLPTQTIAGESATIRPDIPNEFITAFRYYKTLAGNEMALYFYDGLWPSPSGADTMGNPTFHKLRTIGASWRRPLAGGIINLETAYLNSREDPDDNLPNIRNSEWRALIGYSWEVVANLQANLQWSLEAPNAPTLQDRHTLSLRLTQSALNQNLTLSLFLFYSPTDNDNYTRFTATYKLSDQWTYSAGINLFTGNDPHTAWGQFDKNDSAFLSLRYSF